MSAFGAKADVPVSPEFRFLTHNGQVLGRDARYEAASCALYGFAHGTWRLLQL
jgi:hypothetical protein